VGDGDRGSPERLAVIFDEIVVGSGLAALGVVIGFARHRRIFVIGGPLAGQFNYYDRARTKVCAYLENPGLGTGTV
jgi:hypothetical protein